MADELFKTMMKKFGSDLKVWIGYAEFMMGRGHLEAARRLLEKSFKSLPKAHRELTVYDVCICMCVCVCVCVCVYYDHVCKY